MMMLMQTTSIRLLLKPAMPRRSIRVLLLPRHARTVQFRRVIQLGRQMAHVPAGNHGTPLDGDVDGVAVDKRLLGAQVGLRRRARDPVAREHGGTSGVEAGGGTAVAAGREVGRLGHGGGLGGGFWRGLPGAHDAVPVEEAGDEGNSCYSADDYAGDAACCEAG